MPGWFQALIVPVSSYAGCATSDIGCNVPLKTLIRLKPVSGGRPSIRAVVQPFLAILFGGTA
jgi:hypothetical protein